MKITKGMKLTDEQKAQRKASRARNNEAWLDRHEKWKIKQAEEAAKHDQFMTSIKAEIARLKDESQNRLQIIVNLEEMPEVRRALEHFHKINFRSLPTTSLSQVAFKVLLFALTRPDQLQDLINGVVKYRRAEGYEATGDADNKIICGWIAGRKEYRTRAKA